MARTWKACRIKSDTWRKRVAQVHTVGSLGHVLIIGGLGRLPTLISPKGRCAGVYILRIQQVFVDLGMESLGHELAFPQPGEIVQSCLPAGSWGYG